MSIDQETLVNLTADIVSAHVSNNSVGSDQLATLIANVYGALQSTGTPPPPLEPEKPKAAVSARASIKPEHLISMIDGKPYKMLKRHLALHGYTPGSYRETFGLASDYPMVAANYAEKRRNLALQIGLGRKAAAKPATPVKPARKPRAPKAAPQPSEQAPPADA